MCVVCMCEGGGEGWEGQLLSYSTLQHTQTSFLTAACPQVIDSEYLAGAVVGTFIATTLLYTMILLVSICALIYWNKRHR